MARLQAILALCMAALAAVKASSVVEMPISTLGVSNHLNILATAATWTSESASTGSSANRSSSQDNDQLPRTSTLLGPAVAGPSQTIKVMSPSELPVFFFHGLTGDANDAVNIGARLRAAGRTFTALSFCEGECSKTALYSQVPLAIAQIRSIIAKDVETYANGYIFMGHSQGGLLCRGVIEEMDDHNAVMFISLAGVLNGHFNGPQPTDATAMRAFATFLGPATIPATVFDTTRYSPEQQLGQMQYDLARNLASNRDLGDNFALANHFRSPDRTPWLSWNPWLPVINNINICADTQCEHAKTRRRSNFLRLQALHSLASARDSVVSPWQTSFFAQYNDVSDASKIISDFEHMMNIPMEQTVEYIEDTYGLKTLHTSGRLHLREVSDVDHVCWIRSGPFIDDPDELCSFDEVFDTYIHPLLDSTVKLGRTRY